jgi:hypothetical protein
LLATFKDHIFDKAIAFAVIRTKMRTHCSARDHFMITSLTAAPTELLLKLKPIRDQQIREQTQLKRRDMRKQVVVN